MRAYSMDLRQRMWADCRAGMTTPAIERAGRTVVYLPPNSPDYNPIELAFAKIKARLRAAELRTIDKVENFFGTVHLRSGPVLAARPAKGGRERDHRLARRFRDDFGGRERLRECQE